jgi:hypothetical protein
MTAKLWVRLLPKFGAFAHLSRIMARVFVTWVRRSVAKPVRLGKEPSKLWRKILVRLHGYVVTYAYANIYREPRNVRA